MKLKIGENEYTIKFGYKPTLKEHLISKFVKMTNVHDADGEMDFEKVEDLLLFIPEAVLIGLQVHHKDFRYDYDTKDGKEEMLNKAFDLVEKYMSGEEADAIGFFNQLQEALLQDSFLRGLFQKEQKKQEEAEARERAKLTVVETAEN